MNTDVENELLTEDAEKQKLNLIVKVDETSACERHVTVTIPRDDIERYFSEKFDDLAPKAEVPGFRLGKAPRKLVENRFREQVEDQVKGSLLMDSLAQISDDEDFSAISEPDFDFESIDIPDEGPMTYEFNIEVRPEFDMPEWKGMKLKRTEQEFSDEEIDEEIVKLGSRSADMVPVEEAAQLGDFIVVDIVASHEDKEIAKVSEQLIELRPTLSFGDAQLESFGELLVGEEAGAEKTVTVKVSEFASNEDLQGKEVDLTIRLLDVKRVAAADIAEVTEKLGFDSLDALRDVMKDNLGSRLQYAQRQEIREQISALLTESATWELPQDLLKRQSRREMDRAIIELRSSGFAEPDIQAQENQLRQNVMKRTETTLKEHFILERIAEAEQIEETDQDFDLEIMKIAAQRNDSPRRVRARLERTGQMDALRNMIIEQKVLALIEEHAEFEAIKPKVDESANETAAIDFFVSGNRSGESIPEAKYADAGSEGLPDSKD